MSAPLPPPVPAPGSAGGPTSPPPSTSPEPSSPPNDDDDAARSARKKSNYYFFKSTPAHEAQKYMPTLLTPSASFPAVPSPSPSPVAVHPSPSSSPSPEQPGGSRWNAAGTWEEKDLSSWAHTRLTALLSSPSLAAPASAPSLTVTVTKVTGDATLVFTRGKRRVGYDLQVTAEWSATVDGAAVKGGLELPSIDQTSDDDFEVVVTVKERAKADDAAVDALTRGVRRMKDAIGVKIVQFSKELQEQ